MSGATEEKKEKATSIVIEGSEFSLPFKMSKTHFTKMYSKRFGEKTDEHYDTLKKA